MPQFASWAMPLLLVRGLADTLPLHSFNHCLCWLEAEHCFKCLCAADTSIALDAMCTFVLVCLHLLLWSLTGLQHPTLQLAAVLSRAAPELPCNCTPAGLHPKRRRVHSSMYAGLRTNLPREVRCPSLPILQPLQTFWQPITCQAAGSTCCSAPCHPSSRCMPCLS